jgi:primosomal replication protein N
MKGAKTMAKNKNLVVLSGNLGRDPIMSKTGKDIAVMNVTLANHKTRDKDKDPVWVKLAIWGKYATALEEHVQSGRMVVIDGTLRGAEAYFTSEGKDKAIKILQNANSYGDNLKQLFIDLINCVTAVPVVDVTDLEFGGYDKKDGGETAETAQSDTPDLAKMSEQMQALMSQMSALTSGEAEAKKEPFA